MTCSNNRMVYSKENVFTCVNAEEAKIGTYGYFCHEISSLKKAVTQSKTNRYAFYGRLSGVLTENMRARFSMDDGQYIFSLFYPTDEKLNAERY